MSRMARCLALILAVLVAHAAHAATQNAVVYGTVYDATGNAMPGVSVVLENAALGFSRTATTGSDGAYNFAEVPPADDYKLTASRDGKTLDIRAGISVNVGDERVILPPLKEQAAAATGGQVVAQTVAGQAVSNETVSTTIGGVITGDQLRSLPLYNRNFLVLGLLTPNVRETEPASELAGASFSIAGQRVTSNNFLLDGSDNVASSSNQAVPFQVNDSIQEFRVTSSTASAEYGRNQGGTVNVVTRRGGNAFHGSAYGYFANDRFNGDSPLSVYNGSSFDKSAAFAGSTAGAPVYDAVPLSYNDYVRSAQSNGYCTNSLDPTGNPMSGNPCTSGGFFGGGANFTGRNDLFDPATVLAANDRRDIPFDSKQFGVSAGGALSKDKLFYFASYEGTRIDNPNPIFERVPSTFDRTFDNYGCGDVVNGFTGTCFTVDPIFLTQIPTGFNFGPNDPNFLLAQDILSLFPAANVIGVPGVLEFFRGEAPNFTDVDNGLFRMDYTPSEGHSWTGRYVVQKLNQLHSATLPEQSNYPGNGAFREALNQNLSISYSHTFSSTVINEIRGGFNRFRVNDLAQDRDFDATTLGVPTFNLPNSAMPTILLSGLDTQYSGAVRGANGAFSGWSDPASSMFPTLDSKFPMARLGAPLGAPAERVDTTLFFADNLSITYGRHGIKLGGELRHLRNRILNGAHTRGFIYSSNIGEFTSDSETCNEGCADPTGFFGGTASAFTAPSFDFAQMQQQDYIGRFDSTAGAIYIQDTYRAHPRWTINYGIRYEYFSVPQEVGDRIYNFEPLAGGLVQQNRAGSVIDPFGTSCGTAVNGIFPAFILNTGLPTWNCDPSAATGKVVDTDENNFSARGGLAWDMFGDGKTVLRFGIGWFYDHLPTSYLYPLLQNRPSSGNSVYGTIQEVFGNFCPFSFNAAPVCGTGISILNPAVQGTLSPDGVNNNDFYSLATSPFGTYARDTAHSKTPYTRQISATVQQALGSHLTVETGYIAAAAENLPVVYNSNFSAQFNPAVASGGAFVNTPIFTMTHQAESRYHALMVRARAADWHGLRLNAAYSLANSEDNASTGFYPTVPLTLNNLVYGYQSAGQASFSSCIFFGCGIIVFDPNTMMPTNAPLPVGAPNIDFSPAAVTTTGGRPVQVSPYLVASDPARFLVSERGRSDFHTKHRFVLDYTWDVPYKGKWMGNWQVAGIFTAQSGQPFTIFSNIFGQISQRAVALSDITVTEDPNNAIQGSLALATQAGFDQLNGVIVPDFCDPVFAANFQPNLLQHQPGVPCNGSTARNEFTGPNFVNFNFAVQKGFPVFGEGRMLTVRAEFYNLTNRANFYNPISTLSDDGFTLNPDFGKIKSARDPRQIQLAVRFTW